jgi:adenosylcobinamide kinase/adenosylcobinamide-phosphate guanylyltransferase
LAGRSRSPAELIVDGVLRLGPGFPGTGTRESGTAGSGGPPDGFRVERIPGGWDVTGPGGARLLAADGSGITPEPPAGAQPYGLALLDMLAEPAQLGGLRHRGLAGASTVVAVLHADHRVSSEEELARRCGFWDVAVPQDGDILATPASHITGLTAPAGQAGQAGHGQQRRVLVLGGARSGKSRHAELRLAAEPHVTYLAAGPYPPGPPPTADPEWSQRVAVHQSRRPPWWRTVETLDAAAALRSESRAILFDGAGTWLAAVMAESGAWADGQQGAPAAALERVEARVSELIAAWRETRARVVAVTDEVGSSVHPETHAGRLFRDQLGWLNQRLAAESEEAVLMVAGRALSLPG